MFILFNLIRSQFLIAALMAYVWRGILPSSSNTPMFVVCFCTPKMCLQAMRWNFSIGLSFGGFRPPQKSLKYKRMGFMRVSRRCKVVLMCVWKDVPIEFFSLKNAFMALFRRSLKPVLISPEGVIMNPRYLNVRTVSILVLLILKFFLINLPVLLNIMH